MTLVLFIYLVMIVSAISMILTNNPVYSLKFLILIFLNFGFVLIYHNVIYLGFIFIMVYVGAVTILFLFVVMMLDIKYNITTTANYVTVGFFFTFLLSISIFSVLNFNMEDSLDMEFIYINNDLSKIDELSILVNIGVIIFNYHFINVIIVGLLLLVATIGAIYLTHNTDSMPIRRQFFQNRASSKFFYSLYYND